MNTLSRHMKSIEEKKELFNIYLWFNGRNWVLPLKKQRSTLYLQKYNSPPIFELPVHCGRKNENPPSEIRYFDE